jgi:hypothetical protein
VVKAHHHDLERECLLLTAGNESELAELTKRHDEFSEEQAKVLELTQIVEQKGSPVR